MHGFTVAICHQSIGVSKYILYGYRELSVLDKKFSQTHDHEKNFDASEYSKDDSKPLPIENLTGIMRDGVGEKT